MPGHVSRPEIGVSPSPVQFVSGVLEHMQQEQAEAAGHNGSQSGGARHFKCFSFQLSAAYAFPGAALCFQLPL